MEARYLEQQRTEIYRNYVCESLRLQGEHKYLTTPYKDIVNPKPKVSKKQAMTDAIKTLQHAGVVIV